MHTQMVSLCRAQGVEGAGDDLTKPGGFSAPSTHTMHTVPKIHTCIFEYIRTYVRDIMTT